MLSSSPTPGRNAPQTSHIKDARLMHPAGTLPHQTTKHSKLQSGLQHNHGWETRRVKAPYPG
eukprot:1654708-Prorocentrum_lima.AAC.1